MIKVMIVDDSMYMRAVIKDTISKMDGYEIIGEAANGDQAIDTAIENPPDLITLDNVLPDMLGVDIAKVLLIEEEMDVKIIMISGVGQDNVVQECMELGVSDYVVKPFTPEQLTETIENVMSKD